MANARVGNKIYVDSPGSAVSSPSQPVRVTYIIFTTAHASDKVVLRETADGPNIMTLSGVFADHSFTHDYSRKPIQFMNGIFVHSISPGATATFITSQAGSD